MHLASGLASTWTDLAHDRSTLEWPSESGGPLYLLPFHRFLPLLSSETSKSQLNI